MIRSAVISGYGVKAGWHIQWFARGLITITLSVINKKSIVHMRKEQETINMRKEADTVRMK